VIESAGAVFEVPAIQLMPGQVTVIMDEQQRRRLVSERSEVRYKKAQQSDASRRAVEVGCLLPKTTLSQYVVADYNTSALDSYLKCVAEMYRKCSETAGL
jgi:hypothetical protein